jgi:pimeloyl-ACP methyl ester carboxylesterase
MFASSGGATNALALVAQHPDDVRTLVAHEPPNAEVLPDRENAQAVCRDIRETYLRDGYGPAMAKFIGLVMFDGPIPDNYLDRPAPDPAMFGLPTQDDGNRTDPLLNHNIVSGNTYAYDLEAVRAAPSRVVIGVGATSGNALAARGGRAVAELLGTEPVTFPGGHDGFLGGEFGQTGEPDAFAARLHLVLDGAPLGAAADSGSAAAG